VFLAGGYWGAGAWLVDSARGERQEFLGPPIETAVWSPGGDRLAVVTHAGALGSLEMPARIELYEAESGSRYETVPLPAEFHVRSLSWIDSGILVTGSRVAGAEWRAVFYSVSPGDGSLSELEMGLRLAGTTYHDWMVFESADRSGLFLTALDDESIPGSGERTGQTLDDRLGREFSLYRLSVDNLRLLPRFLLEEQGSAVGGGRQLSYSGGYWEALQRTRNGTVASMAVIDLETGEEHALAGNPYDHRERAWLAGDRFVWIERVEHAARLRSWRPGGVTGVLREWRDGERLRFRLERSPDGTLLLLRATRELEDASGRREVVENLVYDAGSGSWIGLSTDGPRATPSWWSTRWAGTRTLCWSDRNSLALESLDDPGELRYLVD
jgi:hypothetical protein